MREDNEKRMKWLDELEEKRFIDNRNERGCVSRIFNWTIETKQKNTYLGEVEEAAETISSLFANYSKVKDATYEKLLTI